MYPLQTLFEIRERAKKGAEEAYAKEKQKLDIETKKLNELQEKLKQMKALRAQKRAEYFQAMASQTVKIEVIKLGERHLEMLLQREQAFMLEIDAQKRVVEEAQERVKQALEAMMKATEDYKVLEKHKENWSLKQKKIREEKEESESDDLTQSRYNIRLKESAA